jgi:hypothetical protein
MKVVAVLFIVLQSLAALALFALSVHGPSGLLLAAPLYLAGAAALTVLSAFRVRSFLLTLASGAVALALAPGIFWLLGKMENIAYASRLAGTQVADVRDESIISKRSGRPIGVRISFTVSVPDTGYFGISPQLYSGNPATGHLQLAAMQSTLDGTAESKPFEKGRSHTVVAELYPTPLFIKPQGERCLSQVPIPKLPEGNAPAPLRLDIPETPYGAPWRGGREEWTQGAYDLVAMYRAVLAEELKPCKVGE